MPVVEYSPMTERGIFTAAESMAFSRVYVIGYASSIVKVGYTADVYARWRDYKWKARKRRDPITTVWFSPGHTNAKTNEDLLIGFCAERWEPLAGHKEFFADAEADAVCAFAEDLAFRRVPLDLLGVRETSLIRNVDAFVASVMEAC